jgi:hypothetical protein
MERGNHRQTTPKGLNSIQDPSGPGRHPGAPKARQSAAAGVLVGIQKVCNSHEPPGTHADQHDSDIGEAGVHLAGNRTPRPPRAHPFREPGDPATHRHDDARPGVELALIGFASTISLRGSSHRWLASRCRPCCFAAVVMSVI